MKFKRIIYRLVSTLCWTAVALLLLVFGVVQVMYSDWFQDDMRAKLVEHLNATQEAEFKLDKITIDFPLNVTIEGLSVVEPGNDTLVALSSLNTYVKPLPLLQGEVMLSNLYAYDAKYRMGTVDSLQYMKIAMSKLMFYESEVLLNDKLIDLSRANIEGGYVDLIIKEDTVDVAEVPNDSSKSKQWTIKAQNLNLKNFGYNMAIQYAIDSLGTKFGNAHFTNLVVDLDAQKVEASLVKGENADIAYVASNESSPKKKNTSEKEEKSQPWTIAIDTINFEASKALYTTAGVTPSMGMDFGYILLDDLNLTIADFYNCASEISLPITQLSAKERCGITLRGSGVFAMDSLAMQLRKFDLTTDNSQLKIDGKLGLDGDITRDFTVPLMMISKGSVAVRDIATMFPLYKPFFKGMPLHDKIILDVNVSGAVDNLTIKKLYADVAGRANVNAKGYISKITNFDKMRGALDVKGEIVDADFVNAYLEDDLNDEVVLPKMTIAGVVDFSPGLIEGDVKARTNGGDMAMAAKWNNRIQGYDLEVEMDKFPIDAFMPRYGIGKISGTLVAEGQRFDPFDLCMQVEAEANLSSVEYRGVEYKAIYAKINKYENNAEVELKSEHETANLDLMAVCKFNRTSLDWDLTADVRNIDLFAFNLDEPNSSVSGQITSKGFFDNKTRKLNGELQLSEALYQGADMELPLSDVNLKAVANDSVASASLRSDDLLILASTTESLDNTLGQKFIDAYTEVATQVDERKIDVEKIQQLLPRFNLMFRSGANNLLAQQLAATGYEYQNVKITFSNNEQINLSSKIIGLKNKTTAIDTLAIEAHQYGKILMYSAMMGNRPGTLDEFSHVEAEGYLANDLVSAHVRQRNINGEEGYDIGALAQVGDSIVTFELFPDEPIIAYRKWEINDENYIKYNLYNQHIDADVTMKNDVSSVRIYTEQTNHFSHDMAHQEDIIVDVKNLQLSEWVKVDPDSPPMKGNVSTNMRINWGDGRLNGAGNISLEDFFLGNERVGSFVADVGVTTDLGGHIKATADLIVDGHKTVTVAGSLNDESTESPFQLDMTMINFPLTVLNPMLPEDMVSLSGSLNGMMKISGDKETPIFNGKVSFDSTLVKVDMIGTSLKFSEEELVVEDNVVTFEDFKIRGVNDNPLAINGTVDFKDIASPTVDLNLKARNMQIVGSNKSKKADVYGKGYVDIDADVVGDFSDLDIDATVDLLRSSNVTYIISDASSSITSYNVDEMVKFVDFSDTTIVDAREKLMKDMAIDVDVALIVSPGSTINVDLSTDGKNRVQLQGEGTLNYSHSSMDGDRMTGRYTINDGFVRYTPPLMSEKLFNFKEGSYVAFNGDMLNPTLSLSAVDDIKANVTQEGRDSRLINFDVQIDVTNTLSNMNVAFDLSTPDDITIANELSSMSAEQRANQAMNMLLYNVYSGPGATANTNLSGNPLYAFVESKVNSWVANNVKFVDISFGIDQYDKTIDGNTSKTTSYSYKVSKTLFDDRFKIVVGGNYSTDADADENYSQNLINDISFEYMINKSGSMYVKLFRQVGYESILEGEVTQTGVGFVYKRKIKSLRDLFR